jgi:glycosyltransferase involved in cell wall biosynthesis
MAALTLVRLGMRIGIDAHMIGDRETGNETYIINLVNSLVRIAPENTYIVYVSNLKAARDHLDVHTPHLYLEQVSSISFYRLGFEFLYKSIKNKVDLFHFTYHAPFFVNIPYVVTVHDISFMRYPEFFSLRDLAVLKLLGRQSAKRSRGILTVSECSKQDILEFYGVPEELVHVTYEGVDRRLYTCLERDVYKPVLDQYEIRFPFLLSVGNIQPRKNLTMLVNAYAELIKKYLSCNCRLVVVGKSQWQNSKVFEAVKNHQLDDRVIFTGYVPNEHLAALYNSAVGLIYIPLYEGFGLPPLEAMACGCPVLASNRTSIPEVVRDAGILVDPENKDEILSGLEMLIYSRDLRVRLENRMRARVSLFSVEEMARRTLRAYARSLDNGEESDVKL